MKKEQLLERVIKLEQQAQQAAFSDQEQDFSMWYGGTLSFISTLLGKESPYYERLTSEYESGVGRVGVSQSGIGVLNAIRAEIEGGYLQSLKGLVSAEIFTDFLEMAEHLLAEKYKDASAVIVGSVLEQHLKELCIVNGLETMKEDGKPKKANSLNDILKKENIYNALHHKNVTAWLGLRNDAAHGNYDEYSSEQVDLMLKGVREFMACTLN